MKELSIEGKATRYDQAIKVAKSKIKNDKDHVLYEDDVIEIFPELAELEDEKIRKVLIEFFDDANKAYVNTLQSYGFHNDKAIAWLEKHKYTEDDLDKAYKCADEVQYRRGYEDAKKEIEKQSEQKPAPAWMLKFLDELRAKKNYFDWDEHRDIEGGILAIINWMNPNYFNEKDGKQKPIDKAEPKFKVGDWVVCEAVPRYTAFKVGDVVQISSKETLKIFLMFKDCFRPWAIQDAKCCDILVDDLGNICIYQEPSTNLMYHSFCYGNHKHFIDGGGSHKIVGTCPATKEQSDTLMKAMADAGYTFDFEKKELRKLEPKSSEWREEDKELMKWSINNLTELKDRFGEEYGKVGDCINWLKSLKPQTKQDWSQNDIDMIDWLIRCCENEHEELCNDKYGHQDIVSDLKRDCRKKWNWLESLKNRVAPQKQWKPTAGQMVALDGICSYIRNKADWEISQDTIHELYSMSEQLKKLREE